MQRSSLRLSITAQVGKKYVAWLSKHLIKAHQLLRPALSDLSVAIVDDKSMSKLHLTYMNLPGPTDVLTFPLDENPHHQALSGEVIVCLPEARRRAKEFGTRVQDELLLYALHGLLHLCSFDDRTTSDYKKMHAKEDQILRHLGIGNVFKPARGEPPKRAGRTSGA